MTALALVRSTDGTTPSEGTDALATRTGTGLATVNRAIQRRPSNAAADRYTPSTDTGGSVRYRAIVLDPDSSDSSSLAGASFANTSFAATWGLMDPRSAAAQYWFYANLPSNTTGSLISFYA